MNLFKRKHQLSLALISLLSPWIVQAADIPLTGPMPFEAMDKNRDNAISPDEFISAYNERKKMQEKAGLRHTMNQPGFLFFDVNGDSRITAQELNDGRIRMRQQNSGTGRAIGQGMGMGGGRNMPEFSDFDLNNDGILHKEEFYEARAKRMYMRADEGFPMRNAASAPAFEDVDTNGDGEVTTDEFKAHQLQHRQMRQP
ncbi:MAG: EF-hand domain-containing protein [Gammaproteobacteria bacterium]